MTIVNIRVGEKVARIDSTKGFDLSIPLRFRGKQPSAFGVGPARVETVENDWFIGDTHRGGSCNVDQYTLIPHCQGTHTECVGHIINDNISISEILNDVWIPTVVLSVEPERANDCSDRYVPAKGKNDELVSKNQLIMGFDRFVDEQFYHALIIRTLPNNRSKTTACYKSAPYFSNDAMEEITRRPIRHLLVDLPSVDRMDDQGKLSNHRIYWGIAGESHNSGELAASSKTITEFIYVPDEVKDGYYLLNLQIPPFMTDAAPSRPMIFPLRTA